MEELIDNKFRLFMQGTENKIKNISKNNNKDDINELKLDIKKMKSVINIQTEKIEKQNESINTIVSVLRGE